MHANWWEKLTWPFRSDELKYKNIYAGKDSNEQVSDNLLNSG